MSSRCAFHFISSLTLNLMMKRTADYPSSSTMKGAFDFAIMSARLWAYLTSDTTWRDFKVLFKGSKNDRMKCALLSPNSSYLFLSYPFFVWIKQTIIPLASPKMKEEWQTLSAAMSKHVRDCLLCLQSTNDLFDFPSLCWLYSLGRLRSNSSPPLGSSRSGTNVSGA